jgi:predicted metal-binding protein
MDGCIGRRSGVGFGYAVSPAASCISSFMSTIVNRQIYRIPWKGQLLLACRKCQKKLKRGEGAAKLSKALKRRARQDEDGLKLRVIEVPCLKMCPKGGITVCTQAQLGRGECSIVRNGADVDSLYQQCKAQHSMTLSARPANEVSL